MIFSHNEEHTGHGQHSSKFVICVVLFVIRVVLLSIVMFYVFVMCKCVLPPGVNPIAVDKCINTCHYFSKFSALKMETGLSEFHLLLISWYVQFIVSTDPIKTLTNFQNSYCLHIAILF
jgi:hypothetical protein